MIPCKIRTKTAKFISQAIPSQQRIISNYTIQIKSALLFDRIAGDPATELRIVVAVVVVNKFSFFIKVFTAEAEGITVGIISRDLCQ